jgi:hypothetical protein
MKLIDVDMIYGDVELKTQIHAKGTTNVIQGHYEFGRRQTTDSMRQLVVSEWGGISARYRVFSDQARTFPT